MSLETFIHPNETRPPIRHVLSSDERQKILVDWNKTESNYDEDKTLSQLFEEQAAKAPQSTALMYEGNLLSYRELNEKANQFALYLRKLNVKPNSLIAISLEPTLEMFIGILGILKAGAAYVPLDMNYPDERLFYMLQDTQAAFLITQSDLINRFNNTDCRLLNIDTILTESADFDKSNLASVNKPDDLAYIIYTSGSTGKPKGSMISHRNVNNFIHWFGSISSIQQSDIVDFSSSISFDFSVSTTLFPVMRGARIAICPPLTKKDPNLYISHLLKNKITIAKLTPSYFRELNEFVEAEHQFLDLRFIVCGGEAVNTKDIKEWLMKFPDHIISNEYGPTEATVASSWFIVDKNNINQFEYDIPIGKPVYNTQLYILDPELQPVPVGEKGELYIAGACLAKGYLNKPQITHQRFIKNPFVNDAHAKMYKTGDVCSFLPDGNIRYIGRVDNQIKIRGFRVETSEIELHLNSHHLIKNAIVVSRKDSVIAYFMPKNHEMTLDSREIKSYLHEHLPEYMIPNHFISVDQFPLTPNGKLDINALPEPETAPNHGHYISQSPTEKKVKKIWSEVLNVKKIDIDDNFFELGGHSLDAARIIHKIEKVTNKIIKLSDIYHFPTIRELSNIIDNEKEISKKSIPFEPAKTEKNNVKFTLSETQFLFWLMESFYPKTKVQNIVSRKRLAKKIDKEGLHYAFECVFKKHPILSSYISTYLPLQYLQNEISFNIFEKDLQNLSDAEIETELNASLNYLERFHCWKKGSPLIAAKIYHLSDNISELQISLSHFISDEISPDIIFTDLSNYYKNYINKINLTIIPNSIQYKDYILKENEVLTEHLHNDIHFWDEYLEDVSLFHFPLEAIISNPKKTMCTSYFLITEKTLINLQQFCKINRIGISDSLCAGICQALSIYLDNDKNSDNKSAAFTFVKSTRESDIYEKNIGLFVRTNLIKVDIDSNSGFIELAKRIQKAAVITSSHQRSPLIIKLAFVLKKHWENWKITNFIMRYILIFGAGVFKNLKLNPEILLMFWRIFLARKKQNFLININILNNFMLNNDDKNPSLFDSPLTNVKLYQSDKMVSNGVLDIGFYRDDDKQVYLSLSGNLSPSFRQSIGNAIIQNITLR